MVIFSFILWIVVDKCSKPNTTVAFIIGCLTSIICGYFGMRIAVYANVRTTFKAMTTTDDESFSTMDAAFKTAFRSGSVMGFSLTSIGVLFL